MARASVPDLLEQFGIKTPRDYYRLEPGARPTFVSRFYKSIIAEYESTLDALSTARGLKLHFAGRAARQGIVAKVPSDSLLKKLAFYTNRTLITYPLHEVTSPHDLRTPRHGERPPQRRSGWLRPQALPTEPASDKTPLLFGDLDTRRSPGGGEVRARGQAYYINRSDFHVLLDLFCKAKPAVAAGVITILPVFPHTHQLLVKHSKRLLPATFQLAALRQQFEEQVEDPVVSLYLPTCSDIPLQTLLRLRRKESDAHLNLQRHFEQLLFDARTNDCEARLLACLQEIDNGVAQINRSFMSARKFLFSFTAVAAATDLAIMLAPVAGVAALGDLQLYMGAVPVSEIAVPYLSYRREVTDLRSHKFYLPWRASRAHRRWFKG